VRFGGHDSGPPNLVPAQVRTWSTLLFGMPELRPAKPVSAIARDIGQLVMPSVLKPDLGKVF
jgi:hypothetical protein